MAHLKEWGGKEYQISDLDDRLESADTRKDTLCPKACLALLPTKVYPIKDESQLHHYSSVPSLMFFSSSLPENPSTFKYTDHKLSTLRQYTVICILSPGSDKFTRLKS